MDIDNNYSSEYIKSLKPSNIRKCYDQELIGLINKNGKFFLTILMKML